MSMTYLREQKIKELNRILPMIHETIQKNREFCRVHEESMKQRRTMTRKKQALFQLKKQKIEEEELRYELFTVYEKQLKDEVNGLVEQISKKDERERRLQLEIQAEEKLYEAIISFVFEGKEALILRDNEICKDNLISYLYLIYFSGALSGKEQIYVEDLFDTTEGYDMATLLNAVKNELVIKDVLIKEEELWNLDFAELFKI